MAEAEKNYENTAEYFKMMRRSVMQLDNILKEILDYSRNERLSVVSEQIDLTALINECFERLRYITGYNEIIREIEIREEEPCWSDRLRLNVILGNLISNAIKYADPHKGEKKIAIYGSVGTTVSLRIEDNGVGIEPAYLSNIFNMFYRASEVSDGAGLGLYIVKEAITRLKGEISVESVPGKGTSFLITLPNLLASVGVDGSPGYPPKKLMT